MYNINESRLISTFIDLVKIPSPSWHEHGLIEYISKELTKLNIQHEKIKCDDSFNLLVNIDGDRNAKPILFSCHMDTVVPCEKINPIIDEKKISSDGNSILGSDDKAAVASFLEAMRYIKENNTNHGPLEFLFSCAEEIGLYGVKGFDFSLIKSKYAFVFDSSGETGKIILKAPYHISMDVYVYGKAAHAGMEPEKGISAIRALAEIICEIPHGRIDKESTVNAGIISGGRATNIVAEEAYCKLEARSINYSRLISIEKKIKNIIKMTAKKHGARVKIKRRVEYPGFSINKDSNIVRVISKSMENIQIKPKFEISGGGSDTNIFNGAGVTAVNLSIGMRNVHTTNEYIYKKDIINGAKLVLSIIDTINK